MLKTEVALFSVGKNERIEITPEMKDSMRHQLSNNMSKLQVEQIPDAEIEKLQLATQALQSIKSRVEFIDKQLSDVSNKDENLVEGSDSLPEGETSEKGPLGKNDVGSISEVDGLNESENMSVPSEQNVALSPSEAVSNEKIINEKKVGPDVNELSEAEKMGVSSGVDQALDDSKEIKEKVKKVPARKSRRKK